MPELPEVETIKNDLLRLIKGVSILDVKALQKGSIRNIDFELFRKIVKGAKITNVKRRAKNLIIELNGAKPLYLLIHFKMTGHMVLADAKHKIDSNGRWVLDGTEELHDPFNQYIRVIFYLSGGKILAFSDLRKFGWIKLLKKEELEKELAGYGPEALEITFEDFRSRVSKKNVATKKVLMDQTVIAGIGNIYADDILWEAKIHPKILASKLSKNQLKEIYEAVPKILGEAIKARGTSTSDFRDAQGRRGNYGKKIKVYRRTDEPCLRCGTPISRISLGGRGTHFCPKCQKLTGNN